METTTIITREPIDSDWQLLADLYNLDTDESVTATEFKRRYDDFPAGGRRLFQVVPGESGEPIALARSYHRPGMGDGVYYSQVNVFPEHRRRGIGRELYAMVDEFLETERATVVTFFVKEDDPDSFGFAERRGYVQERVLAESKLDLTSLDLSAFHERVQPEGVEIFDVNDLGDVEATWRVGHRLLNDSDDAPDADLWGKTPYEDYYRHTRCAESYIPEGVLFAKVDGEFAGIHTTGPIKDSDGWTTDYTGVLPDFRRRGVAFALKLAGARVALAKGAKWIMTHNDSANVGMLAINYALGFVPQPGYAQMRKRIERSA